MQKRTNQQIKKLIESLKDLSVIFFLNFLKYKIVFNINFSEGNIQSNIKAR